MTGIARAVLLTAAAVLGGCGAAKIYVKNEEDAVRDSHGRSAKELNDKLEALAKVLAGRHNCSEEKAAVILSVLDDGNLEVDPLEREQFLPALFRVADPSIGNAAYSILAERASLFGAIVAMGRRGWNLEGIGRVHAYSTSPESAEPDAGDPFSPEARYQMVFRNAKDSSQVMQVRIPTVFKYRFIGDSIGNTLLTSADRALESLENRKPLLPGEPLFFHPAWGIYIEIASDRDCKTVSPCAGETLPRVDRWLEGF